MIRDSRKKVGRAVQAIRDFEKAKERLLESVLTTRQVAEIKGVTQAAVRHWVRKGDLRAIGDLPEYGHLFDPESVSSFDPPARGYRGHRAIRESTSNN